MDGRETGELQKEKFTSRLASASRAGFAGAMSKPATLRLRVTATAETILRSGHPWLFADSVREQNREGRAGDLAVVFDRKDKFLAVGLYDPDSPIRLRVLHVGKPQTLDAAWWREHLRRTLARREGMFDAETNAYRLINGESDGWPGLVLDRYDTALVLKLYTAAWLPRLGEIAALLKDELKPGRVVLRLSRNIQEHARAEFGLEEGEKLSRDGGDGGEVEAKEKTSLPSPAAQDNPLVVFTESGLRFEADVVRGQKTGFFLDQRENRRRVESLAAGREVLNAFSFSGGFSLYAARGGAKAVLDLDISSHALENARRNFALNSALPSVAACRHETLQTDAFTWLERNVERKFDLVVLDPPSLAKRETERAGAIQAYAKLAASGIRSLRAGGVLVAASCSAHVSATEFFNAMHDAAHGSGRKLAELANTLHAADHPATFAEAQYLKCIFLEEQSSG